MKTLGICGAGGYSKEIFDLAQRINKINKQWKDIIFIEKATSERKSFYGSQVISERSIDNDFLINDIELVSAVGEPAIREKIFLKLSQKGYSFVKLIDPTSIVSETAIIEDGCVVGPFSIISSSVRIGKNVAINIGGIVGHDIHVGQHSVLSSYTNIGGGSVIGIKTYIGMGAMIKEGLSIGSETIIGMGSVVYDNITDNVIALGNPARPMRRNEKKTVFKK